MSVECMCAVVETVKIKS